MNISFIGFGSMAKAIARRLCHENRYVLCAAAPSLSVGINKDKIHTHSSNLEVIKQAQVIILAVKPGQMNSVLREIAAHIPPSCLLISIAAGLSLPWFARYCRADQAIIRTMPNTPASIGMAATPMIANEFTSAEQKHWAELIFSSIGLISWIEQESEMDSFTALSGSGPAYLFLFLNALIDAAITLGIEPFIAKKFALQTCKGALNLAENSDLSLTELRTQVTSPGGTTAAALNVLHPQLDELILTAMSAAKKRAFELGQIY